MMMCDCWAPWSWDNCKTLVHAGTGEKICDIAQYQQLYSLTFYSGHLSTNIIGDLVGPLLKWAMLGNDRKKGRTKISMVKKSWKLVKDDSIVGFYTFIFASILETSYTFLVKSGCLAELKCMVSGYGVC